MKVAGGFLCIRFRCHGERQQRARLKWLDSLEKFSLMVADGDLGQSVLEEKMAHSRKTQPCTRLRRDYRRVNVCCLLACLSLYPALTHPPQSQPRRNGKDLINIDRQNFWNSLYLSFTAKASAEISG